MELVVVVARLLWLRRNALVFGRPMNPIHMMVTLAFEALTNFCYVRSSPALAIVVTQSRDLRWTAPPTGFVKVNWHAAVYIQARKMGIGVIVCDSQGEVLAGYLIGLKSIHYRSSYC